MRVSVSRHEIVIFNGIRFAERRHRSLWYLFDKWVVLPFLDFPVVQPYASQSTVEEP